MIGWYAHHHGMGHLHRARSVIPHIAAPVTLFSSHPADGVTRLPIDVEPPRSAACAAAPDPVNLHYAPLGVDGVRQRMAALAAWAAAVDPDLFVVDVSVEVAALMRLLSVPTAVVRQHGRRDDPAHEMCYRNASLLLAPYPEWLEEDWVPQWVRDKTSYTGGFSRFDDRIEAGSPGAGSGEGPDTARLRSSLAVPEGSRLVVVLRGAADDAFWPIDRTAQATPGWHWVALGPDGPPGRAGAPGDVADPLALLRAADVVVTSGSQHTVMEAAAACRPLVVVPYDRPYDAQRHRARRLQATGVAHVEGRWPEPSRWSDLLEEVAGRTPDPGRRLVDGKGARRAGEILTAAAERLCGGPPAG